MLTKKGNILLILSRRNRESTRLLSLSQANFAPIVKDVVIKGGRICFSANGASMAPFISEGDTVTIAAVTKPRVGHVVLSESDSSLILHRIIRITNCGVITCGDSNLSPDQAIVPFDDILGRVIKVVGNGGNIHLYFPFSRILARLKSYDGRGAGIILSIIRKVLFYSSRFTAV